MAKKSERKTFYSFVYPQKTNFDISSFNHYLQCVSVGMKKYQILMCEYFSHAIIFHETEILVHLLRYLSYFIRLLLLYFGSVWSSVGLCKHKRLQYNILDMFLLFLIINRWGFPNLSRIYHYRNRNSIWLINNV